jgi:excisionase family DNA binding protein
MTKHYLENNDAVTLAVTEVAKFLGISRGSAYEAIQRGEIPHIRIGRRILISRRAFERLLDSYSEDKP